MALLLPRFISMGFQGKYLECVQRDGDSNGLLQLSGEDVMSPKARIEVEKALCSDELVHLKCCYKNKYLRRKSEKDDTIVAAATKPEEDQSKWSCTLFRPRPQPQPFQNESEPGEMESALAVPPTSSPYINIDNTDFQFQIMAKHNPDSRDGVAYYLFSPSMQGKKVTEEVADVETTTVLVTNDDDSNCLKISSISTNSEAGGAAFRVTDRQAVTQLPQYIILKADNPEYLQPSPTDNTYLVFRVAEENVLDAGVFEVIRMGDGSVRLRLYMTELFLVYIQPFIRLQSGIAASNNNSRFIPMKVGTAANGFALKVQANNMLCKRYTGNGQTDSFGATTTELEIFSGLEFKEPIISRSIYGVNYRMEDRMLYDYAPVTSVTKDVTNESQTTQAGELIFTYTETKSSTWEKTDSWGVGVSVSMSARIPFIGGTDIGIGTEYEGEYRWGETKETETEIATKLRVEVPPMSRTQVTMIVSRGTLEVPFSYTQRDTLYSGQVVISETDGGVFSGVNTYVSYETNRTPL